MAKIPTYRSKQLGFYGCSNEEGVKAVVMATKPDQARETLKKEGFKGYFRCSFMGYTRSKPSIIYVDESKRRK